MNLDGSAVLHAEPDRVWSVITDPAVLARTIPGCETLEQVGDECGSMPDIGGRSGSVITMRGGAGPGPGPSADASGPRGGPKRSSSAEGGCVEGR